MPALRPVLAYHLILTCYGFWLPNDPRGSGSTHVWADALKPFGPATAVNTRHSVAARPHDRAQRLAAKRSLRRPPVRLSGRQARAVVSGFRDHLHAVGTTCLACSVMPDHAHLVLRRSDRPVERLSIGLKAASVRSLLDTGLHPDPHADPAARCKLWARGDRHVFLFDAAGIERAVRYVQDNPVRAGFKPQCWSFVEPIA